MRCAAGFQLEHQPFAFHPHFELRDLPRSERLSVVPAEVSLHSAKFSLLTIRVGVAPNEPHTDPMKTKEPVVKQLYRLNVEPRVIDQLSKLAARTGEPKTRIATRLFTEAVMSYKPASPKAKNGAR